MFLNWDGAKTNEIFERFWSVFGEEHAEKREDKIGWLGVLKGGNLDEAGKFLPVFNVVKFVNLFLTQNLDVSFCIFDVIVWWEFS